MCGVVGIIGTRSAAREAFLGLTVLQHRGQDAAGILSYDSDGFHRVKNLGLVESVFTRDGVESLTGNIAIGHARYSTIGRGELHEVQPFLINFPYGIGMVHNGNIVNVDELKGDLRKKARHLLTHSDTEIVLNLLADGLAARAQAAAAAESEARAGENASRAGLSVAAQDESAPLSFDVICSALTDVMKRANGSYSIVTLIAGEGLLAFRDPNGIRPLIWGKRTAKRETDEQDEVTSTQTAGSPGLLPTGEAHMVASESVALAFMGYEKVRDLAPGEVVFIDMKGQVHSRVLVSEGKHPCMFEWIYFASPESEIDGQPVYGSRIELGKSLGKLVQREIATGKIAPDLIVPVPETSRIAAIALAEQVKIPYREVLIKNRYIKRTFILDSQEKRQKAVNLKLSPVRSEIQGKKILLVDDSIVRGTTSKKIIDLVRQAGATAVYFVSTCPPIRYPCYYGIDFPSGSELIAHGRSHAEIEAALGADAVIYQDMPGLNHAVGGGAPCTACLDGKYPTDVSSGASFAATRGEDRRKARA